MQSKTSLCNPTLLKKNITRFLPVWSLYALGLLAWMALILQRVDMHSYMKYDLISSLTYFSKSSGMVSAAGALVIAQALFGDLYNSRSCFALHALPVRRETWFFTNVISGLIFGLLPCLLGAPMVMILTSGSCVVNAWQVPLYLAAGYALEYLFSFGLAVLCVFCAGNRMGMLVLYGMAQGLVAVVGLLVESIYLDLLPGVFLDSERYWIFCPLAYFYASPSLSLYREGAPSIWEMERMVETGLLDKVEMPFYLNGEIWQYYGLCALLGLGMLALALVLYRRRQLECAGDMLAFPHLDLVFLIPFTFCVGGVAQGFYAYQTIQGDDFGYFIFMALGLFFGWFGGLMLLRRSVRVFSKRAFLGLGAMACAVALSLGLTWLDPFQVQTWVPEPEEVESVHLYIGGYGAEFSEPDLPQITALHQMAIQENQPYEEILSARDTNGQETERFSTTLTLNYNMKEGKKLIRRYHLWVDGPVGPSLKKFSSRPEIVLRDTAQVDPQVFDLLEADGKPVLNHSTPEDFKSLWASIQADCYEGTLSQDIYFHTGGFLVEDTERNRYRYGSYERVPQLSLNFSGDEENLYLMVYADSTHTIKWLTDRGILKELGLTPTLEGPSTWIIRESDT